MSQDTAVQSLTFLADEAARVQKPFSEREAALAGKALCEAAHVYRSDLDASDWASALDVERGLTSMLEEANRLHKRFNELQGPRWKIFRRAARVSVKEVSIGEGRCTSVVEPRRNPDWFERNAEKLNYALDEMTTYCADALLRIQDPDFRSLWWAPNGRPVDWPFRRLVAMSMVILEHFCGRATAWHDEAEGTCAGSLVRLITALGNDFGMQIEPSKLNTIKTTASSLRRDGLDSRLLEPAYRPLRSVAPTIYRLPGARNILRERKRIFSPDRRQPLRRAQP